MGNKTTEYTPVIDWGIHGDKCAECGENDAHRPDHLNIEFGLCQRCYVGRSWANNVCMAPGCNNQMREVGDGKQGVFCEQCFDSLSQGGQCTVPGCNEESVLTTKEGYKVCHKHANNSPVPIRQFKEQNGDENGKATASAPAPTTKETAPTISESGTLSQDEERLIKTLTLTQLRARRSPSDPRANFVYQTAIIRRVQVVYDRGDSAEMILLDELLAPPGAEDDIDVEADTSQPQAASEVKGERSPDAAT